MKGKCNHTKIRMREKPKLTERFGMDDRYAVDILINNTCSISIVIQPKG